MLVVGLVRIYIIYLIKEQVNTMSLDNVHVTFFF